MKILVPIDGSALSLVGLRHAIALVRGGLQAELLLANVQRPATLYEWMRAPNPEALDRVAESAGQHALDTAETLLREARIDATEVLVTGEPSHALLDLIESEGCDAVVMGAHGGGGWWGAWQGSVSQNLLSHATVPVTLVKPATADALDHSDVAGDASEPSDDPAASASPPSASLPPALA